MEIGFKDLVKLIHPDQNPNIQDASGKMTLALKNRRDKKALWNLGVRWGVVNGELNQGVVILGETATVTIRRPAGNAADRRPNSWNTGLDVREQERRRRAEYIRAEMAYWARIQAEVERIQRNLDEMQRRRDTTDAARRGAAWEVPNEPIRPWRVDEPKVKIKTKPWWKRVF